MISSDNFSSIYSRDKVDEIVEKNKECFYYKSAYRIIKHSIEVNVTDKDFYPTIMEYNNYEMPSYEKQNAKTKLGQFGTSCFDTLEHLKTFIESVTSFREKFENSGWFIMKGRLKGTEGLLTN